jgi:hypothetical protein
MSNFLPRYALISMMLTARSGDANVSRLDPTANWLLGQLLESVLDRTQCLCNDVHFVSTLDAGYKFDQVAFEVSQEFIGPSVHFIFLS